MRFECDIFVSARRLKSPLESLKMWLSILKHVYNKEPFSQWQIGHSGQSDGGKGGSGETRVAGEEEDGNCFSFTLDIVFSSTYRTQTHPPTHTHTYICSPLRTRFLAVTSHRESERERGRRECRDCHQI